MISDNSQKENDDDPAEEWESDYEEYLRLQYEVHIMHNGNFSGKDIKNLMQKHDNVRIDQKKISSINFFFLI